jgi:chorismate mutase-like protein
MDLQQIRSEIDTLDTELLEILHKRFSLMPHVIDYKIKHNLPIFDSVREAEVLKNKIFQSKEKGIDPEFLKKLFTEIMNESKNIQKKYIEKK